MDVDIAVSRFRDRHLASLERVRAAKTRGAKLNAQLAERAREHLLAMLPERFERELDPVYEAERKQLTPEDLAAATTRAADLAWQFLEEVGHEDAELYQATVLREDARLYGLGARRCIRCQRVLALAEYDEAPGARDGFFRKRRCRACEHFDTRHPRSW